ncbi:hypothetical protein ACHAW6_004735 [Cyclotella cf. meneghiniana]
MTTSCPGSMPVPPPPIVDVNNCPEEIKGDRCKLSSATLFRSPPPPPPSSGIILNITSYLSVYDAESMALLSYGSGGGSAAFLASRQSQNSLSLPGYHSLDAWKMTRDGSLVTVQRNVTAATHPVPLCLQRNGPRCGARARERDGGDRAGLPRGSPHANKTRGRLLRRQWLFLLIVVTMTNETTTTSESTMTAPATPLNLPFLLSAETAPTPKEGIAKQAGVGSVRSSSCPQGLLFGCLCHHGQVELEAAEAAAAAAAAPRQMTASGDLSQSQSRDIEASSCLAKRAGEE